MDIQLNKFDICDFSTLDSIGVICRGQSLGSIYKFKDNFKNSFLVGQYLESFKKIGKNLKGSNFVKIHGNTFSNDAKDYLPIDEEYGIIDMQTYLDPTLSDRKAYKLKKIGKRNIHLKVYPRPLDFLMRNDRFNSLRKLNNGRNTHPTLGLFAVDLAAAYAPKDIYIIGLDFYSVPDFVKEKKSVSQQKNRPRMVSMVEYLELLCDVEENITFHLYTCCKSIKPRKNLEVIRI